MKHWQFFNPVRVHFGVGSLAEIGGLLAGRSYVIVTYPDAVFAHISNLIEALAGPALLRITSVEPNPSVPMLRETCAQLTSLTKQPDILIALGGGSVMDTVKVLAAEHGRFEPVYACLTEGYVGATRALPIIAIPTTAGTGSEVTSWATVWDPENTRKLSLSREDLYPESVLIDPELMAGLPAHPTVASGLDALSHALESLWNVNASPVTRGLAIHAARELMAALPLVMKAPHDISARSDMALGALRAGLAFSNTRTALAHNISYAITLNRGVAHGIACSFSLPAVMQAAIGIDSECDAALAEIFGDLAQAPTRLATFLDSLGVATHPAAYGMTESEWQDMVNQAFDGARGRNFIGTPAQFPQFDFASYGPQSTTN